MNSHLAKLVLVLFLVSTISFSRHQRSFACAQEEDEGLDIEEEEEDIDAWDDDIEDDDGGDNEGDPWDNTGDYEEMEGALPSSVFAVIHLAQDDIPPGLMEFIQYELPNYPKLSARDVKQSPPMLRFFASQDHLTAYTISEALENDAVPEDQLEQVQSIDIPERDAILRMQLDSIDLTELSEEEIRGALADYNVQRVEVSDEDMNLEEEDDDTDLFGEDGEPVEKPRRRKKRPDWRKRRAERLAREKEERKVKGDSDGGGGPGINLVPGYGLAIPGPILFLLVCGGFGAAGYLGHLLLKTQQETLENEERKRAKTLRKNAKKLKKAQEKIKRKR